MNTQHMNNTTNNDWAVVLSAPSARRLGEAEAGLDDHEISLFRNALVFLLNAPGIGSSGLLPQFEHHSRLYPGSVEAVLVALASASGDEPELSQRVAAAWWQWQQLVADQLREQEEAADHLLAQQLAAEQAEAERQRQQAEAQQLRQQRFPPERLAQQCGYPMHIARDFQQWYGFRMWQWAEAVQELHKYVAAQQESPARVQYGYFEQPQQQPTQNVQYGYFEQPQQQPTQNVQYGYFEQPHCVIL